jgi:hypothetical protein
MPTRLPCASTTGNPLILLSSISFRASITDAPGATLTTCRVITSLAFIVIVDPAIFWPW